MSEALSQMGILASDQVVRRLALLAILLENDAVDLGFLGPNEGQRVMSRHLLESAALLPHLLPDGPIVDVGSGAGLPGLVLAALGCRVALIETQAKRVEFLRRAAAEIHVDVDVRHARAEDEGRGDLRDAASSVVARALAAPAVAFELCLPLVRPGGRLLLPTTPEAGGPAPGAGSLRNSVPLAGTRDRGGAQESPEARVSASTEPTPSDPADRRHEGPGDAAERALAPAVATGLVDVAETLGAESVRWQELSVPGVDGPRWVMMVDKRDPTPDRFPRRPGVPKRRPLGGDVASVN